MTTKEKAGLLIQTLDDDVSLDDVIDRLYLLRKIELGIAQADAGDVIEPEYPAWSKPKAASSFPSNRASIVN